MISWSISQSTFKNNLQDNGDETHLTILGQQDLAKWKSADSWDSSQSQRMGRGNPEVTFLGSFRHMHTKTFAFFLLTWKGKLGTDRDIHADISVSQINVGHAFHKNVHHSIGQTFHFNVI